ncbi:beta strand repeat-containing protein [Microvirga pudoricolor]|uniref:beta strand repeat-containing protein n=1 Tax=Microvirga pudoricolor TaxID=2778729 RepID=UPI00194ED5F7|nr:hypothetical protein [Microvirga pudoricolor]MBM6593590.1 hypothetical protein [Microvirga pudoricolor]
MVTSTRTVKKGKKTVVETYQRPQTYATSLLPTLPLIAVYSIGGNGGTSFDRVGQGGAGGTVTLTLAGIASANAWDSPIVHLRSIGGSDHTFKPGISHGSTADRVALDTGGNGGAVTAHIMAGGKILADGANSPGLVAESRGGHGGTTGDANSSAPLASNGGNGRSVTFTNHGEIATKGDRSMGAILQSVGGLGGDNSARSGGYAGGSGGDAGSVAATIASNGKITTSGAYAFGLVAQAIGGAGGRGAGGFFVGGEGGSAGDGGTVRVTNLGSIETKGEGAAGLVAQSTGGGTGGSIQIGQIAKIDGSGGGVGGKGGFLFFGGGGQGGKGGDGKEVNVINEGSITTSGNAAFGILAQSVGGSGGTGGRGASYGFLLGGSTGGDGGGGGNGGSVNVGQKDLLEPLAAIDPSKDSINRIITTGKSASAILGQSVGGGGGFGGTANTASAGVFGAISIAVGGDGGKGGDGGNATVDNVSSLNTTGQASHGIEVRSVGGGGGKAGDASAYAVAGAPPGYPSVSFAFSVGGTGGNGGNAKLAKAVNRADISTEGQKAYGILAQSIGGGGGSVGSSQAIADTVGLYKNLDVAVAVGGRAGGGGNGGASRIVNASTVTTKGAFSTGILGSSVGGGGGEGGLASSSTEKSLSSYITTPTLGAVNTGKTVGISAALGGTGGKGGSGNTVTVKNLSTVDTKGIEATGIFAQSVGGGGGRAGGYLSKGSKDLSLNVGGSRLKDDKDGGGGDGGAVEVTNAPKATITTDGHGATGIFAQSVGGGGGVGGSWAGTQQAPKLTLSTIKGIASAAKTGWAAWEGKLFETKESLDPAVKLAQKVAALENAKGIWKNLKGTVDVGGAFYDTLKKEIQDQLKPVIGEVKKNDGKFPLTLSVAVGGSGGKGGAGKGVSATNAGSVGTEGNSAYGIFAQSVGGGGGFGGGAVGSSSTTYSAQINVGGTGGEGGESAKAAVTNSGSVITKGAGSIGLFSQSVGGGGGVGGTAANPSVFSGAVGFALGGTSGKLSDAGAATITNSGTVATQGKEAHGLVAQSIGGGGGVYFAKKEGIIDASEIQKIINDDPAFKHKQINSEQAKILVESLAEWLGVGTPQTTTTKSTQPFKSFSVEAGLGGRAFTGGNAGAVSVTHSKSISTEGVGAIGIFAQSVGGGGGFGSDVSPLDRAASKWSLGGTEGVRGNGGAVNVTFDGRASITTAGAGATGVFLQSIGGGGGYGGTGSGSFSVVDAKGDTQYMPDPDGFGIGTYQTLYYGTSGNGGPISVNMGNSGGGHVTITTAGPRAHGLFAQSLGAGGGTAFIIDASNPAVSSDAKSRNADEMQGQGGTITVSTKGDILAKGPGSYGVFLQSGVQKSDGTLDATRLGGTIRLKHSGRIEGGAKDGAAIRIDGGLQNEITLLAGSHVQAESGKAIMGSYAKETVVNGGTLIGDIDLVSGGTNEANTFANTGSATYQSGMGDTSLKLGRGGRFTNSGALNIAGSDMIGSLAIAPGGTASLGGSLIVDVNSLATAPKDRSDLLTGQDVTLQGVVVRPRAVQGLLPGQFTVISATRLDDTFGAQGQGPAVKAEGNPGSPFSWSASRHGSDVRIAPSAGFSQAASGALTPTEQSVVDT